MVHSLFRIPRHRLAVYDIFKTHFLRYDSQDRLPLTSHLSLVYVANDAGNKPGFLALDNQRIASPGALDRRYTGDTHDPAGLREEIEGVAVGH